jgi:hypothetical protein
MPFAVMDAIQEPFRQSVNLSEINEQQDEVKSKRSL